MSNHVEDLAGLVSVLVTPLVEFEDDLRIDSFETEEGSVMVEIRANAEDAGKIIGRQGRVIKAVRTLARAAGSRAGVAVDVELID